MSGTTRRSFLVRVMGVTIGTFLLPGSAKKAVANVETSGTAAAPTLDLLLPPRCSSGADGRIVMVYIKSDGTTMVWQPDTDEELAEAKRFYEAGLNPGCPQIDEADVFPIERTEEEQQLIAAILDRPDDDHPRDVYADWLIRQGNPIGEIIRIDLLTDRISQDDPRHEDAMKQYWQIMEDHGPTLYRPLAALGLWPTMWSEFAPHFWLQRGLVQIVNVNLSGILPDKTDWLFQAAPALTQLIIRLGNPDVAHLLASPKFNQLRELSFETAFGSGLTNDGLIALTKLKNLSRLEKLEIDHSLVDETGIQVLLSSSLMEQLTSLNLSSCKLWDSGAKIVANSNRVGRLKHLRVDSNKLSMTGVQTLLTSSQLLNLESLDLSSNNCEDDEFDSLTGPPPPRLEKLTLSNCHFDDEPLLMLMEWLGESNMVELTLDGNNVTMRTIEALTQPHCMKRLKRIELSDSPIGNAGAEQLARIPRQMESLKLNDCDIHADGVKAIASAAQLAQLTTLELAYNPIGLEGAKSLANSRYLQNLKTLHVGEHTVGEEGQKLLTDRFGDSVVSFYDDSDDD